MRRKLVFAVFSVLVILAVAVSPTGAITGNWVRDFEHPFVGLIVFYDENNVFIGRCSGSLLDPYNFLTAGHCVVGADRAIIYFQQDAGTHYDPTTQLTRSPATPSFVREIPWVSHALPLIRSTTMVFPNPCRTGMMSAWWCSISRSVCLNMGSWLRPATWTSWPRPAASRTLRSQPAAMGSRIRKKNIMASPLFLSANA